MYNEPKHQPAMPAVPGIEEGIVRGIYRFPAGRTRRRGTAVAAAVLRYGRPLGAARAGTPRRRLGVRADVWSVTSWTELRRDAMDADDATMRGEERTPFVTRALAGAPGPVLAVSDWMRQVPDQISQWIEQDYYSLGTDGFGLSDTREDVRRYFRWTPSRSS